MIDATGLVGAAVAFLIGLAQYRRAQQWKRAEFLAQEVKELESDPHAMIALTMVDWPQRSFRLHALEDSKNEALTLVTYATQIRALRPHTMADVGQGESAQPPQESSDSARPDKYPEDPLIRDCYDALLKRLDRLGAYLHRHLVSAADLAPYIGYYIDDIAAMTSDPTEALWTLSLLTYIHFYHFTNIPGLFREFHYDVSPSGKLYKSLLRVVAAPEHQFAEELQSQAAQEASQAR